MITAEDLIHLPYTADLTEAGIAYACRSLAYIYDRMDASSFDRLQHIVGNVAVELTLRRYLGEEGIPFGTRGVSPFTDPNRHDITLGGHRCDVKSYLIAKRGQITDIRRDPACLLQAPALVPLDQYSAGSHNDRDIYLFAFLCGLTTISQADLQAASAAGQPFYLIHPMPKPWARPSLWQPLGSLVLKSGAETILSVELGGQTENRNFLSQSVELPPRKRVQVEARFYTLAYIHAQDLSQGRIGIHSPSLDKTVVILPHQWGNIWVYGMDILLAGYITHEEVRRRASLIRTGSRTLQYGMTHTRNLAVPIVDLHPLGRLFERVREWESATNSSDRE